MAADPNANNNINPDENLENVKYIIVSFSFGMIKTNDEILPGATNNALAYWIKTLKSQEKYKNSIILSQWEITNVLSKNYNIISNYSAIPDKDNYLCTLGVSQQFIQYCKEKKINVSKSQILLVSHPDHFERCKLTLTTIGKFNIINNKNDIKPDWKKFGCDKYGYDDKSTQEWTRNKENFIESEKNLMIKWKIMLKQIMTFDNPFAYHSSDDLLAKL